MGRCRTQMHEKVMPWYAFVCVGLRGPRSLPIEHQARPGV